MTAVVQPVVAIVGHIDHGKTTLLDYIRKTSVASGEAGGITQRLSAYEITHTNDTGTHGITFIDTPGHEAFMSMRKRGARSADIAVLIVASDDGVKPQTIEAKKAIEEAGIPYIVAFTKIDKPGSNLERAKDLVIREGIYLEGLGGDVPWVALSGKTGEGVPELLDTILLVAEINEMKLSTTTAVSGIIIETERTKTGVSATVILKSGTLTTGGFAVSGSAIAPLRIIENFKGEKVQSLRAGQSARVVGFNEEPVIGSPLVTYTSKKEAEAAADEFARAKKAPVHTRHAVSDTADIRVVIKADSAGAVEALAYELNKIPQEKVHIKIVGSGVGTINENDVKLLIGFSPAALIGFNVKIDASAKDLAERQHVAVELRSIIYELSEWLTQEIAKYEPEDTTAKVHGTLTVLKYFSTTGSKHVVGGRVESGTIKLGDAVVIVRRGIEVGKGKITNLQLQRSNASSVGEGLECGLQVDTKADVVQGDLLESHGKHV